MAKQMEIEESNHDEIREKLYNITNIIHGN